MQQRGNNSGDVPKHSCWGSLLWLCGSCVPSWVATAPEAFLAASAAPAGTNGGGGPSAQSQARITTSFSSILRTRRPVLGLLLRRPRTLARFLSLSARRVRRAKQFRILQPIKAPDSQFPAAETPQGAVGVQRLAHGHDQTIVSLTCTVDLGACASPTSGP
ncbi:hypothetical protein SNOG_10687 [Parastagonospora nodorum SN15]|uniref:Uncharacterized protein n=1 Tax=Phaeosphaeria nodorum (strain SN15 / ATCC MYA-4574 / FGSC 10173) TaxID=321614 RepID=Q0UC27_PHANO|nr:hypothetical protein SNOG_10687 [Parastagonospora nodorum SN15]EAT82081.1 hypothetical protein SNOG_10687 [Parastagonospora nodorum SN15]